MNQLVLNYEPSRAILPRLGTQHRTLLDAFYRNERLTVAHALTEYNIYALSQRAGELKRLGWPILSELIETPSGKHVACYWIEF